MAEHPDWPEYPAGNVDPKKLAEILYQARVNEADQRRRDLDSPGRVQADIALEKAQFDAEFGLRKVYFGEILDFAKSSADRARAGAEFLEKTIGAIALLYTGLLALVFSATDNPLPAIGIIPAGFLGLALTLDAAYLAYISRPSGGPPTPRHTGVHLGDQYLRTAHYVDWVSATVMNRRYAIKAAIFALGFAVLFLPVPFITSPYGDNEGAQLEGSVQPVSALPALPAAPESAELLGLLSIRYEAIIEIAKQDLAQVSRESGQVGQGDPTLWWILAAIALGLVFAGPFVVDGVMGAVEQLRRPTRDRKHSKNGSRSDGNDRSTWSGGSGGRPGGGSPDDQLPVIGPAASTPRTMSCQAFTPN